MGGKLSRFLFSAQRNYRTTRLSRLGAIFALDRTFPPVRPKFEKTPIVAIKQGGTVEAATNGVREAMDSMVNIAERSRCRVEEKWQ